MKRTREGEPRKPGRRCTVVMCQQRDPVWRALRSCFVTASDFGTVLGMNRYKTQAQLVKEMLSPPEDISNRPAVRWGIDHEADGVEAYRVYYEATTGRPPELTFPGIAIDLDMKLAASPDGFVGDDGIIEIKCPFQHEGKEHKDFYDVIPSYQVAQVVGLLGVTRRKFCDHVQWTPSNGIWVTRYWHDEEVWQCFKQRLEAFYDAHRDHYEHNKSKLLEVL